MNALLSYLREQYHVDRLGDATWVHAVNSKAKLKRFLNDAETMLLEVDIRISSYGELVAAHPPAFESDLTFDELLQAMASSKQGLKLDFKDPEALYPALTRLREVALPQPILLHADVLRNNPEFAPKFSPVAFLALCEKIYPQGFLSIGWTTAAGVAYSKEKVDQMLALCRNVQQATFPVRASLLEASWEHLTLLLQKEGYSLTIWNVEPVEEELLTWMRANVDPARTLYDLTDQEKNPVRLR